MEATKWTDDAKGEGASRSRGNHLREPSERDQRRIRPMSQVWQCGIPEGVFWWTFIKPGDHPHDPQSSP